VSDYFDSVASTWDLSPMRLQRALATAEMVRSTHIPSNRCLVDFGGGTGLLSSCLKDDFEKIVIVDTSEAMLNEAERKISESGITNISTSKALPEDACVSVLVSLMALHHVNELNSFLSQAAKCIQNNGFLMIADLYSEDGSFHQHEPGFDGHNGFDVDQLSLTLKRFGFTVHSETEFFKVPKTGPDGSTIEYPLFFLTATKEKSLA
jgi:ubiquinone/menaquinone biosynthesis C-methylase UbiE